MKDQGERKEGDIGGYMNKVQLKVDHVSKHFMQGDKQIEVLRDISVLFENNTTYAIMGVSGTGKSTFMHILAGLDTPSIGKVFFDNTNLSVLSEKERALFFNKSVGLLFQLPYLIRELSVIENVALPGLIAGNNQSTCLKRAQELLSVVGLTDKQDAKPSSLSGGQQQRVALARALFNRPAFLLADEPTGNLDIKTGKDMVALLLKCHTQWGMGIIVSTHDAYVAENMQKIYQIKNGRLS